jgi:hypothetical protein
MQNGGVILVNTSMMSVGSNVSAVARWNGAQGVLVIAASQFAPIVNLMLKAGDGSSARQIKMNSTALQSNEVRFFYLPAGTYELHSATGSTIGLYAALVPTP